MSTGRPRLTLEQMNWDEYDATDYVVKRRTYEFLTALGALRAAPDPRGELV